MIHSITRITSLVLVFGFFIGCSTLKNTNEQEANRLSEGQLQQRLDSLNTLLEKQKSPQLFYEKGRYLTELALKKEHPGRRPPIYINARQALNKSIELATEPEEAKRARELLKVTWSHEHNEGVRIIQQDSSVTTPNYKRAAAHFNNATVVIPDSSISYEMAARVYYKNQQNQKAINVLEEAESTINQPPTSLLEQLAFLYLETDQIQKAIETYERAEPFSNQNLNLLHGLSNAYITAGEHHKAAELLQTLIESKPDNVIYRQSLANELYFIAKDMLDEVSAELQDGASLEETAFDSAEALLSQSENQYKKILQDNHQDSVTQQHFAQFYHNSAAEYQQLLSNVDNEQAAKLSKKIEHFLSSSIPLLEQLAEQQPENKQIWRNLYQAYSYLGMKEKAQQAKTNF